MAVKAGEGGEQGKRNTMNRLLAAARVEFARKGLAGARVEEIAREAGVTKQLVYHYYNSKEGLFVAVLDESSDNIMSELVNLNVEELSPPVAMRAVLNHFFDQYRLDPFLGSLALEGIRYHDTHETPRNHFLEMAPKLIAKLDAILLRGAASGDFRADINPRLLLASASLVTTGWFTNRYSMSALAGLDTDSEQGMATWRQYSADFVLASISLGAEKNVDGVLAPFTHSRPMSFPCGSRLVPTGGGCLGAWNQRPASVSLFTQILAHPLGRQPPGHAVYPTARMNAGTP